MVVMVPWCDGTWVQFDGGSNFDFTVEHSDGAVEHSPLKMDPPV